MNIFLFKFSTDSFSVNIYVFYWRNIYVFH